MGRKKKEGEVEFVEEKELRVYYRSIREKWRNRLTGNTIEDTSDEVYQKMMDTLTKEAQELWDNMNKGGNDREYIWSDIAFVYRWQNTMNNVTEVLGRGF